MMMNSESSEQVILLVEGVKDYAILMLDAEGRIMSWNPGAEAITGWRVRKDRSRFWANVTSSATVTWPSRATASRSRSTSS